MFKNSDHYQSVTNNAFQAVKRSPKMKLSQFRELLATAIGKPSHNAVKRDIDARLPKSQITTNPLTPCEMLVAGYPFIINDRSYGASFHNYLLPSLIYTLLPSRFYIQPKPFSRGFLPR